VENPFRRRLRRNGPPRCPECEESRVLPTKVRARGERSPRGAVKTQKKSGLYIRGIRSRNGGGGDETRGHKRKGLDAGYAPLEKQQRDLHSPKKSFLKGMPIPNWERGIRRKREKFVLR